MPNKKKYPGYPHGGQVGPDPKPKGRRGLSAILHAARNLRFDNRRPNIDADLEATISALLEKDSGPHYWLGDVPRMGGGLGLTRIRGTRPRPPLYTAETAPLMTEEEMDRFGVIRGNASGGIVALQQGGGGIPAGGSMTTSYQLNPAIAQQTANLTDRIVAEGQRQYAASPNQRIAGLDPATQTALMAREQYAMGPGPMGTQQAAQSYGQAGQMIQGGYGQLGGIGAQQQNLAGQFGLQGQQARNLAMQDARGLAGLGAQARMQGQTAGAGMLQSGLAAQQEQQLLGGRQGALGTGAMSAIGQTGADLAAQGGMRQTGANLKDYMSQYTKGVVDPQLEALREFQQIQGQQAGSQEAMMGTQGSMRAGVESAQRAQDVSQQAANIIGSAQQDAFRNAQQALQADRAAAMQGLQGQLGAQQAGAQIGLSGLGAQQAAAAQGARFGMQGQQQAFGAQQAGMGQGLQAAQAAANLGQRGYQAQLGAMGQQGQMLGQAGQTAQAMGGMGAQMAGVAGGQAALGAQQQQQQMARMQDLMGVGGYRQDRQQQLLNLQEQDRMNAINQERQNINWQLGAMGQLPYQSSAIQSIQQQQGQQPTGFQSMAATGLAGLGAYGAFRNQTRNQNPTQNFYTGGGSLFSGTGRSLYEPGMLGRNFAAQQRARYQATNQPAPELPE